MSIPVSEVINRWSHLFPDFALSANDFYAALQKELQSQQMPKTEISRVTHKEGGVFSSSREYLRIKHNDLVFDVCAAPFGTNFFISWWLYETEYLRIKHNDLVFDVCAAPFGTNFFISWWLYETAGVMRTLMKNTTVGNVLAARAAKKTFFEVDAEQMFRTCVHDCMMSAVAAVTESTSVRQLTDAEKQYKEGGF